MCENIGGKYKAKGKKIFFLMFEAVLCSNAHMPSDLFYSDHKTTALLLNAVFAGIFFTLSHTNYHCNAHFTVFVHNGLSVLNLPLCSQLRQELYKLHEVQCFFNKQYHECSCLSFH